MNAATKTVKDTKRETVLAIYRKHKDKEAHLPYRDFRKLVVDEITKQTKVSNPGTLGMYFSWARREVLGRPAKQYNRTATRAANGTSARSKTEGRNISTAVAQAQAARKAKTKSKSKTAKKSKSKSKAKAKARK